MLTNYYEAKPYSITPNKVREESIMDNLQSRIEDHNHFSFLLFVFLPVASHSLQQLLCQCIIYIILL